MVNQYTMTNPWTAEEDIKIREIWYQKLPAAEIQKLFPARAVHEVYVRAVIIGLIPRYHLKNGTYTDPSLKAPPSSSIDLTLADKAKPLMNVPVEFKGLALKLIVKSKVIGLEWRDAPATIDELKSSPEDIPMAECGSLWVKYYRRKAPNCAPFWRLWIRAMKQSKEKGTVNG